MSLYFKCKATKSYSVLTLTAASKKKSQVLPLKKWILVFRPQMFSGATAFAVEKCRQVIARRISRFAPVHRIL